MKLLLFAILCLTSFSASTQGNVPTIKQGSKLTYNITLENGSIDLLITIDSMASSYMKLRWSTPQIGTGTWELKSKSINDASTGRWSDVEADANVTLPDDQSVVVLSKAQWSSIEKNKKAQLDMVNYSVKKNSELFKLNGKDVAAIYLENEDGTSKLWILNSPSFPAILKISGNKAGRDAELKSIE